NPGGVSSYLAVCAQIEHFLEYRQIVRDEIEAQVAGFLEAEARVKPEAEVMEVLGSFK
ncbi:MAG: B12-binding domain-containing radical SAM protein, partial [Nostoc sp.]